MYGKESKLKTSPGAGEKPAQPGDQLAGKGKRVDLAAALETRTSFSDFDTWLIGLSPLIVHSWSFKAKLEMLTKQAKAPKGQGRAQRNPEKNFVDSLYEMRPDPATGNRRFGFPATGIKKAILSAAHKDKGLARTIVGSSLWLDAEWVEVKTAFDGASCNLPLVRVYGSDPRMREDMVRVGSGLNKTADLAYRAEFTHWAINIVGRFNEATMNTAQLAFLINESGLSTGIGEWRNEKSGMFGAFVLANAVQEAAWRAFANGTGPLPTSGDLAVAAE
jgi:hypothetical protein